AKVTLRYKSPAMRDFGRVELSRIGKGWGGLVPCGDVVRGVLRYYVVGVDASGSPAATAGDARHPYFVPIRPSLTGGTPSLPGQPPPKKCAAGAQPLLLYRSARRGLPSRSGDYLGKQPRRQRRRRARGERRTRLRGARLRDHPKCAGWRAPRLRRELV